MREVAPCEHVGRPGRKTGQAYQHIAQKSAVLAGHVRSSESKTQSRVRRDDESSVSSVSPYSLRRRHVLLYARIRRISALGLRFAPIRLGVTGRVPL